MAVRCSTPILNASLKHCLVWAIGEVDPLRCLASLWGSKLHLLRGTQPPKESYTDWDPIISMLAVCCLDILTNKQTMHPKPPFCPLVEEVLAFSAYDCASRWSRFLYKYVLEGLFFVLVLFCSSLLHHAQILPESTFLLKRLQKRRVIHTTARLYTCQART